MKVERIKELAIMKKQQYISPLSEAMQMEPIGAIMRTSIEPGPDPAPARRAPELSKDSVQVF